jgi:uncharacterized protein
VTYLDACALLKFIKREKETEALYAWRKALPEGTELATSRLAQVEITRTLLRSGVDHQRIPYLTGQALRGIYLVDLTSTVLTRATTYRVAKLGTLDSIHLASAEPFRAELTEFVTYDLELSEAAGHLGFPISAPC